jgi:hypothetical protein
MSTDPSFFGGCRCLPDELKSMILQHALRTNRAIVSYLFLKDEFMTDVPE